MCGDPLRARWVAETYFGISTLVNDVRNMLAYTGTFRGKRLTVMGHGMGIPSMGIYSYELFSFYNVRLIIRMGTAGSYSKDINPGDLIIAEDIFSYSGYASDIGVDVHNRVIKTDKKLIALAQRSAEELKLKTRECRVFCSDAFYNKYSVEENIERSGNAGVVEMEGFALYANAIKLKKEALVLLTCSDSAVTGESMPPEDRAFKLSDMARLALVTACNYLNT